MPKLSYQDKNERIVDELKVELALMRRDLIERLRRIEDYITFLESDIGRLRLDLQRISDKILESPIRSNYVPKPTAVPDLLRLSPDGQELPARITEDPTKIISTTTLQTQQIPIVQQITTKPIEKKEGLNQTEVAIIRYLLENPGTKSATPIAQTIGKAREHVARTLKKLADEKKIIRDETTWPYTYVVPDDIKKLVSSQVSLKPSLT